MVSSSDIINICFGVTATVLGILGVIVAWKRYGPQLTTSTTQVDIESGRGLLDGSSPPSHDNISLEDVSSRNERATPQTPPPNPRTSHEAISTILQAVSTLLHPR